MSKTKLITITAFLFFISSGSFAQDKTIDSLKKELSSPKVHDTVKLLNIGNLIDQTPTNSNRSVVLNDMMGKLASKNLQKTNPKELHVKYTRYLAAYYSNLGGHYTLKRDAVNAMSSLDKSMALFKSVGSYDEMNYVLVSKGVFYSQINDKEKAIECLFTALKYFEKDPEENQDGISYVNSTLATIYGDQKRYDKAIQYSRKTIDFLNAKKKLVRDDEYRLSEALINCGSFHLSSGKYEEALGYFNKALVFFRKAENNTYISVCLGKIAQVKMEEGKYQEAESLLKEAVKYDEDELSKANTYINLGDLYYRKKDFAQSESFLSEGFLMSKKIKNLELQENASELLLKVLKENNNYKKALEIYEFQAKLNDSSKTEASKNALAQQQLKYSYEKKALNLKLDAEKKAAAKNNWLIALSGTLLLVLLGGYFYYRNNRQKQKITVLEKDRIKQKLLLSQMNPHFIFNSIDNIQSLIINRKEAVAVSYLDSFSRLTRQILENSSENYISLKEEIEMIENYLSIQQLLYKDKFDFRIDIEKISDTESLFVPPMLVQPFIENAIKHGLKNKDEKGMIDIDFSLNQEKLVFEIADNGTGFSEEKKQPGHKSMAMKITRERLLNYTRNKNFEIISENRVDSEGKMKGAKVMFEIPYICEN
ncbi:MAG: tetratricopeptide repeat protein [Chryseobacterium sp.]|jgi:tetratricopeptide (TPR) repeat protein|uniref:tetratricopeptide repeat-containing sensor histidine kinase n=1 Tax=Chryseobacterium sp. TaxID=1871047 RepID=UPI002824C05A|nr:tetratricopeptide repeat protein [Chryseobacterium sp.]MDR2237305.1 tetratricopeptide repeat protein [Chryseobacterium sp.]